MKGITEDMVPSPEQGINNLIQEAFALKEMIPESAKRKVEELINGLAALRDSADEERSYMDVIKLTEEYSEKIKALTKSFLN